MIQAPPPWLDTTVRGLRPDTLWHLLLSLPGGAARARQVDENNPQDEHYTEAAVHADSIEHVLSILDDMPAECATAVVLMAEEVDRVRRQRQRGPKVGAE